MYVTGYKVLSEIMAYVFGHLPFNLEINLKYLLKIYREISVLRKLQFLNWKFEQILIWLLNSEITFT